MRASSQHVFSQIPRATIPRSSFRRDMTWKTAFYSGYLVPIYADEALPGDTFNLRLTQFARLTNPLSQPIMDNIYLDTFFFAVPLRLLWEHFERMCGDQPNPGDSIDFLAPIIKWEDEDGTSKPCTVESLSDYLSIPLGYKGTSCTAFWHRAYNLIWNEWFRDENLQDRVEQNVDDGPDLITDYTLLKRGKRHDYFTSCLPFVQKGSAQIVPLSGYAPVSGYDGSDWYSFALADATASSSNVVFPSRGSNGSYLYDQVSRDYSDFDPSAGSFPSVVLQAGFPVTSSLPFGIAASKSLTVPPGSLFADLNLATNGVTINQLREAVAVQRQLERDARGGSRFTEILRSNFGVISPDSRLQRPEYLGGGHFPINIHSVAQTSSTDSETPQANLAAYGLGGGSNGFQKSFVEHSVILGLACVRCDLTYQQGLHRMFSRRSRFDWYWPALHNLGEQAVLNKEIFAQSTSSDDLPFGYQERWAEYRYGLSRITGKLRSDATTSLDAWHLAQDFASLPTLNSDFIEENPPLERALAVTDEPQILYDSLITLNCVRPMGTYSVPGLMDHF